MKLKFETSTKQYDSGSQQARVWTERWVADWMYCPNCGANRLRQFLPNNPVADFVCNTCLDQFEVKSKNAGSFGNSIADGAYYTKIDRLKSKDNPNLLLIAYKKEVQLILNVCIVPTHFFIPGIIQKRAPLAPTARRAGWVGSNILLGKIPESGRIFLIRDGVVQARESVFVKWQKTLFLRDADNDARGWMMEVMKVVDSLGKIEFSLDDVYAFEGRLKKKYNENNNIRPKIRQQLQRLRDSGYLSFLGRGRYLIQDRDG